jgi:hypothetical protein
MSDISTNALAINTNSLKVFFGFGLGKGSDESSSSRSLSPSKMGFSTIIRISMSLLSLYKKEF